MLHCSNSDQHSTQTRHGKIPHLCARIGGYDMVMPVKLKKDTHGQPEPERDKYGYVFALPACRKINLNGDITTEWRS